MIYFEPVDLGYVPLLKHWLAKLAKIVPASGIDLINELLEHSLERGFAFFEKRKNVTSFPFHRQNALNGLQALFTQLIEFFDSQPGGLHESEPVNITSTYAVFFRLVNNKKKHF